MSMIPTLMPLAAIWLAAHLSPGPDFVVAVRMAISQPRRVALQVVAGISAGTAIWALAGYYGVSTLFALVPWLYVALKLGGGAYLIYLGARLLAGSFGAQAGGEADSRRVTAGSAFRLGLLTNLANPKAALFTTSLFAATMPANPSALLGPSAAIVMVAISFAFYGAVACALTTRQVAAAFAHARRWLDRVAGLVFMGLGARFMLDR